MNTAYQTRPISVVRHVGWWVFFLVCLFYGIFALTMGVTEILHQLGVVEEVKYRAVPWIFIIHTLSGSAALISGALNFNRMILNKYKQTHRLIGKVYVYSIWIASVSALWNAIFFDVSLPAKMAFGSLAILWFGATTIAFLRIRKRNIRAHREWMIRSYSLSLFFVTFSFWVEGLTGTRLPYDVAYPLAVFLGWALNLMVAEIWIRRTRNSVLER